MTRRGKREVQLYRLLGYFHKHPGLLVSCSYFLLTFVGIIFTSYYYSAFDIPFLQLADLSDFLIAGITEPMAMVLLFGAIAIAVSVDFLFSYVENLQRRWFGDSPGILCRILFVPAPKSTFGTYGLIFVLFLLPYTYVFIFRYAEWKADTVLQGRGSHVELELTGGLAPERPQLLLGSTLNYLFVYDPETGLAGIHPVNNISAISAISPVAAPAPARPLAWMAPRLAP